MWDEDAAQGGVLSGLGRDDRRWVQAMTRVIQKIVLWKDGVVAPT